MLRAIAGEKFKTEVATKTDTTESTQAIENSIAQHQAAIAVYLTL